MLQLTFCQWKSDDLSGWLQLKKSVNSFTSVFLQWVTQLHSVTIIHVQTLTLTG